jgi:hypothetical protein
MLSRTGLRTEAGVADWTETGATVVPARRSIERHTCSGCSNVSLYVPLLYSMARAQLHSHVGRTLVPPSA